MLEFQLAGDLLQISKKNKIPRHLAQFPHLHSSYFKGMILDIAPLKLPSLNFICPVIVLDVTTTSYALLSVSLNRIMHIYAYNGVDRLQVNEKM